MRRLTISIAVVIVALCTPASGIDYATQINNGAKLLLKEGTDSLFYVYYDDGDVRGDVSDGDEDWDQFVLIEDHDYPAIAATLRMSKPTSRVRLRFTSTPSFLTLRPSRLP